MVYTWIIIHFYTLYLFVGYQESENSDWLARPLTKDHKPESAGEIQRIEQCGGKVVSKSGQYTDVNQ